MRIPKHTAKKIAAHACWWQHLPTFPNEPIPVPEGHPEHDDWAADWAELIRLRGRILAAAQQGRVPDAGGSVLHAVMADLGCDIEGRPC